MIPCRPSPRRRREVPASTSSDAAASPPAGRSAWRGVCRRVARPTGMSPYSLRSLRLSDRVSTSSPGEWETAGRRARVRKGPRSPSGPHALGLRRQGRRHRRRRAPRHPRRSEGMSVRGRTMDRGTAAFRGGRPAPPGGGSGQPCREWTKGSHSPGSRRAARRCSSRERGDWPGPAGRACTGGRRPERRRAAPAQRGRAPARGERGTGTRTGRRRQPPGHTLLLSRSPGAG